MEFERMRAARQAQLREHGDALAVPETAETRMRAAPTLVVSNETPEEIGAPVPGAMAMLAMTAFLVSLTLEICRVGGADLGMVWVLAPLWGSALVVATAAAIASAVAWARRDA